MSGQHFQAAKMFADEARAIEVNSPPPLDDEALKSHYRALVTATVLSAVAGLESSVNELFQECVDKETHTQLKGLADHHRVRMAEAWNFLKEKQVDILTKYDEAIRLSESERLARGESPYQDVKGLIRLRNRLVHYSPEWSNEQDENNKLRRLLRNRFPENPYSAPKSEEPLWFPHLCLGAGCANWAVNSTKAFLDQFSQAMGIPSRL